MRLELGGGVVVVGWGGYRNTRHNTETVREKKTKNNHSDCSRTQRAALVSPRPSLLPVEDSQRAGV